MVRSPLHGFTPREPAPVRGGAERRCAVARFYDSMGNTFDYVYAIEGDTLWIWAGERDSPAYFRGTFDEADRVVSGGWVFPGGGGYDSTMTRRVR